MTAAIEAVDVGRRYRDFWALRGCTLDLPAGSVTAIVGPNGAGKTTLLNLLAGLLPVSEGWLTVADRQPSGDPDFLSRIGFVAQDCPLYKEFSVSDLLKFGRRLNPRWDDALARDRLAAANVPLDRKAGRLSGGQRAQVALALAVAKRPELLMLDEPLASLDPLARREFLQGLVGVAAETGMTVVLSSHLIEQLARVCDHLVVISDGHLRLVGELDQVLEEHRWVTGARGQADRLPSDVEVVSCTEHERHSRLLVRSAEPLLNPALDVAPATLDDVVLAYLESWKAAADLRVAVAGGTR
ncbi:MAG: ABC transporter ATP-binding protein [Pseudonocardiales bacterium]|nr:MAG: ABC transporter ATP-binding protein [Pseudonocardiales bacterium]